MRCPDPPAHEANLGEVRWVPGGAVGCISAMCLRGNAIHFTVRLAGPCLVRGYTDYYGPDGTLCLSGPLWRDHGFMLRVLRTEYVIPELEEIPASRVRVLPGHPLALGRGSS